MKKLKKSFLLLQNKYYENQLQLQANELQLQMAKKTALTKFSLAIDEFRQAVAEGRMTARGIDLATIPIDIPPGLDVAFL